MGVAPTDVSACRVCDGDRAVAVGTGTITDLIDCPVCIGIERGALCGFHEEDAIAMCQAEGVAVRWLGA